MAQSTSEPQESFKAQLDRAAAATREAEMQKPNPIVEKITEFVPGAAKMLGTDKEKPAELNKPSAPRPLERPLHDDKIEEFVRDQHRSMGADGKLHHKS